MQLFSEAIGQITRYFKAVIPDLGIYPKKGKRKKEKKRKSSPRLIHMDGCHKCFP